VSGRIFLVAPEASGDALGADLIAALKRRDGALVFAGVGGAQMAAQGVESLFDPSPLAVLGLVEGVRAYPAVVKLADETARGAGAFKPDVSVLIDSWGFNLRVAQRIGRLLPDAPIVKYIGPQVWAMRAGRAKTLARVFDHLICIYEMERPYYARFALPVTVAGHPAFGRFKPGDAGAFRARHAIGADKRILLLLPGSRRSEIARVAPTLEEAAAKLCAARGDVLAVCVVSPAVREAVLARAADWTFPHLLIEDAAEKDDAFAAATAALAASGTVATEVALQGAPVIVGYRLAGATYFLLQFLFKPRFATLFNIAADEEAAPEFLQDRFTAANVAAAAARVLDDPAARARQVEAQNKALIAMGRGGPPAAEIAADAVMDVLKHGKSAVRRMRPASGGASAVG
jgi:lipid-A-disaccharide synthase